jgi:hypothetical protein
MTSLELAYVRRYLNDSVNFTDSYLSTQWARAELEVSQLVKCLVARVALPTTVNKRDYILPEDLIGIMAITWKGYPVVPIGFEDYQKFSPHDIPVAGEGVFDPFVFDPVVFDTGGISGVYIGKPERYFFNREQFNTIRFYPAPNEVLTGGGNLWGPDIQDKLIVQYFQRPNESVKIPSYVRRLLLRNYTLWKSFEREGDTQNLEMANFYSALYTQLLDTFTLVNEGVFVSRIRQLGGNSPAQSVPPRPQLPSRYWTPTRR